MYIHLHTYGYYHLHGIQILTYTELKKQKWLGTKTIQFGDLFKTRTGTYAYIHICMFMYIHM